MTAFVSTISVLSCKNDISLNAAGTSTINLSEDCADSPGEFYAAEKKNYFRSWDSCSENSQKVKDSVKELEQLLSNHQCVYLAWTEKKPLLLFFNSGAIVNVSLDDNQTKIKKVVIDNALCGKLPSEHLTDAIINESCLLISYSEAKLTYVTFGKQSSLIAQVLGSRKGRIIGTDPQITTVDLLLPTGRRLEKKLSLNCNGDCVLIWWHFSSSDIWPWMPVNQSVDRISLLVYSLNGNSIEMLCTAKTQGELRYAGFSKWHSNRINTLEEVTKEGKWDLSICVYEVTCSACQCMSLTKLPLHSHLTAFAWNHSEDKLLLADDCLSLFIYDLNSNTTLMTSTLFMVHDISWHPSCVLALVASSNGMLQCFDGALSTVKFKSFDESSEPLILLRLHAAKTEKMQGAKIKWKDTSSRQTFDSSHSGKSDTILMHFTPGLLVFLKFSFGCITKYTISPLELINQYLKNGNIAEAVCLLQNLSWCQHPEICFQCLSRIANCLLRKSLCLETEIALEHSLGTFYNSVNILPEAVLYDYHQQVDYIARRFFHHLLRFHKFEKAYLLAVELQSRDLFLDIHHVAKQKQETMLSVIAYQHAEQLDASNSSVYDQSAGDSDSSVAEINRPSKTSMFLNFGSKKTWTKAYFGEHSGQESVVIQEQLIEEGRSQICVNDSNQRCEIFCNKSKMSTSKQAENISDSNLVAIRFGDSNKNDDSLDLQPHSKTTNEESLFSLPNKQDSNDVDEDEEEEDVEGVRVKFSHFGIV